MPRSLGLSSAHVLGLVMACTGLSGLTGCGSTRQEIRSMQTTFNADEVSRFLVRFEELAEREDFDLIRDLIHERAVFRFNDGDFVGRPAIQAAFEKTWRGDPTVKKARFYLSDIVVLTTDQNTASVTYTYNWHGSQGGREFSIRGRGTRVLLHEGGQWRIVHEHLSRFPAPR
jgi:ketosteroid isomerase-like protein